MSKGALFFLVTGTTGCVIAGVWKFFTGHPPRDIGWIFWALAGVSILIDVETYLVQIRDNTNNINEKLDTLQEKFEELESKLDD